MPYFSAVFISGRHVIHDHRSIVRTVALIFVSRCADADGPERGYTPKVCFNNTTSQLCPPFGTTGGAKTCKSTRGAIVGSSVINGTRFSSNDNGSEARFSNGFADRPARSGANSSVVNWARMFRLVERKRRDMKPGK